MGNDEGFIVVSRNDRHKTINVLKSRCVSRYVFAFLVILVLMGSAKGWAAEPESEGVCNLWSSDIPFPEADQIPLPDAISYVRVNRAVEKESQFLHGAAIISFNGEFYASWANSPVNENSGDECVRGKVSSDGGWSWQNAKTIASDLPGLKRRSHGVFFEHKDKLWSFTANFGGTDKPWAKGKIYFENLCTEAFLLDTEHDSWKLVKTVTPDFWPMDEPTLMKNGNWIVGGVDTNFKAAVAIIPKDDILNWIVVKIPQPEKACYAETSVIVDGDSVLAVMRNHLVQVAAVSSSLDFGQTWTMATGSNYPMTTSKPYAGMLSTGQRYLVSNLDKSRDYLTLAVSEPGQKHLSHVWMIRQGVSRQPLYKGWAKSPQWSYPYAYEHDGKLYIIYSVGKEDCELAILPLSSIRTDVKSPKIPVVFDTDIGSDIDDMWALIMLLNSPEFDVKLITTSVNDTQSRAKLTAKILEIAGRTDIPIGIGPAVPEDRGPMRQSEWIEDYDFSKYPGKIYQDGAKAMVDVIMNSAQPIKLIAVGPVPTIDAAMQLEPQITRNAEFIGMHGAIQYKKKDREYNVKVWPQGLQRIFEADWKKTITPLNTCGIAQLKGEKYQEIINRHSKLTDALITAYRQWFEVQDWIKTETIHPDISSSILYDTVAVYLALSEDFLEIETLPLVVTDKGATLVDAQKGHDVRCAMKWKDMEAFEELLLKRMIK